jgi:arginyl-tRNA synthetase
LQYAYARIRSIFRKGGLDNAEQNKLQATITLTETPEIALAKYLLKFGLVLDAVFQEYRPNFLCNYLYELAGHFTSFYENCPVLKSETEVRQSRLALCDLTAKVLRQGMTLLGIEMLEQM